MDLANINDLKLALKLAGLKPQKGLGQNFLVDRPSLEAILMAANVQMHDAVLEVGPGLGVLTTELARLAERVVAVELDPQLVKLLRRQSLANLEVVQADIREYDLRQLPTDYKVVANIPYYLTSFLIRHMLESSNPPQSLVLLIQKEVAQRVVARPGQMSVLALSVAYYGEASIVQAVERDKFWPAPNVDSAILAIKRRPQPAFPAEPAKLFRLIKAGFGEKRKQLRNSLAGGLAREASEIEALLLECGLKPTARAQELTLEQWEILYNAAIKKAMLG